MSGLVRYISVLLVTDLKYMMMMMMMMVKAVAFISALLQYSFSTGGV